MSSLAKDTTPYSHLLLIETHSAEGAVTSDSQLDIELVPLNSIVEVQEELRRRYQTATSEPLKQEDETKQPSVGVMYTFEQGESGRSEPESYCDLVRVYEFPDKELNPTYWATRNELTHKQREHELIEALRTLLASPDLNLDSLESPTVEAIEQARGVLGEDEIE